MENFWILIFLNKKLQGNFNISHSIWKKKKLRPVGAALYYVQYIHILCWYMFF